MASGSRYPIVIRDVPDECESVKNIVISDKLLDFLRESPICGRSDYSDLPGAKKNAGSTWRSFNLYPRRETVTRRPSRSYPLSLGQTGEPRDRNEAARQRRLERKEKINLQREKQRQRVKAKQRERNRQEQLLRELKELGVPDLWNNDVSYSGVIISSPVNKPSTRKLQERKVLTEKAKVCKRLINFKEDIRATQENNHQESCSTPQTKDSLKTNVPYQRAYSQNQCRDGINSKTSPSSENDSKLCGNGNWSSVSPCCESPGHNENMDQEEAISSSSEIHTLSQLLAPEVTVSKSQDTNGENQGAATSTTVIATADSSTPGTTSQNRPRRAKRINYCELLEYESDFDKLPSKQKKSASSNASALSESSARQSKGTKRHKKQDSPSGKRKHSGVVRSKECLLASNQVSSSINEEDFEPNSKSKDLRADLSTLTDAAAFLESIFSTNHSSVIPSQDGHENTSCSNFFYQGNESVKRNSGDVYTSMPSNSHFQDTSNLATAAGVLTSPNSHHSCFVGGYQTVSSDKYTNMVGFSARGHQQPLSAPHSKSGISYGAAFQSQGHHLPTVSSVSQQQQMANSNAPPECLHSSRMHSFYSNSPNASVSLETTIQVVSQSTCSESGEQLWNSKASISKLTNAYSTSLDSNERPISSVRSEVEKGESKRNGKGAVQSESRSPPLNFLTNSSSSGSVVVTLSNLQDKLTSDLSSISSSFHYVPSTRPLDRPREMFIPQDSLPVEDNDVQQLIQSIKMAVQEKESVKSPKDQKKGNHAMKEKQTKCVEKKDKHYKRTNCTTSKPPEKMPLPLTSVTTTETLIGHQNSPLPQHISTSLVQALNINTFRTPSNSLPFQGVSEGGESNCFSNSVIPMPPRITTPARFISQMNNSSQYSILSQQTNSHVSEHGVWSSGSLVGHMQQNVSYGINSQLYQSFPRPVHPQFSSRVPGQSSSNGYFMKSRDVNIPLMVVSQEQDTAALTQPRIPPVNVLQAGLRKGPPASNLSSIGATVSCSVNSSSHQKLVSPDQPGISQHLQKSLWSGILEPNQPQSTNSSLHHTVSNQIQSKQVVGTLDPCQFTKQILPPQSQFSVPNENVGRGVQVRGERKLQKKPNTGASQQHHSPQTFQTQVNYFSDVTSANSRVMDMSSGAMSYSQASANKKRSQDLVVEMLMSSMNMKNVMSVSSSGHMDMIPKSQTHNEKNSLFPNTQQIQTSPSFTSREIVPLVAGSSALKTSISSGETGHDPREMPHDVCDGLYHPPNHSQGSGGPRHLTRLTRAPGSVPYVSGNSEKVVVNLHSIPNVGIGICRSPHKTGKETHHSFQYVEPVTDNHTSVASVPLEPNHSGDERYKKAHQVQAIVGIHNSTHRPPQRRNVSSQDNSWLSTQHSTTPCKTVVGINNSTPLVPSSVHRPPHNISTVVSTGHSRPYTLKSSPDMRPQPNLHHPLLDGTNVRSETTPLNDRSALSHSICLSGDTSVSKEQYPPQNPAGRLSQANLSNDRNIFENFVKNGNQIRSMELSENELVSNSKLVSTPVRSREPALITNGKSDIPSQTLNGMKQTVSKSVPLSSDIEGNSQIEDSVSENQLPVSQPSNVSCSTGSQYRGCKRELGSNQHSNHSSDRKGFVHVSQGDENMMPFTNASAVESNSNIPTLVESALSEAPQNILETTRAEQSASVAGVSAIENAPRDKELYLVSPGGISLTDKQVEYIRSRVASRQEKEAKDAGHLNRIKVKQEAMECMNVEGNDNEDAMSTASSETSHTSHTSSKCGPTASNYTGKPVKIEKDAPPLSSILKSSSSSANLVSPDKSIMTALSYIGSWSKEEVSEWLKKNQLEKICMNLNSLDGKGLQRMAFEYFRDPDHFYARVKKSLGLTVFQTLVIGRSLKALLGDQED